MTKISIPIQIDGMDRLAGPSVSGLHANLIHKGLDLNAGFDNLFVKTCSLHN
jgi:hypothetical protein